MKPVTKINTFTSKISQTLNKESKTWQGRKIGYVTGHCLEVVGLVVTTAASFFMFCTSLYSPIGLGVFSIGAASWVLGQFLTRNFKPIPQIIPKEASPKLEKMEVKIASNEPVDRPSIP